METQMHGESRPSSSGSSHQNCGSINHVIGIEEGRGRYMMGNSEVDISRLKRNDEDQDEKLCAVCRGKSNGIHFGSQSCAACNAFFRRSVVESRKYICKASGDCDIGKTSGNVKGICRACRLLKCLIVGMEPKAVQPHRDTIGKNAKQRKSSFIPTNKQTSFKSLSLKSVDSSPKNHTNIHFIHQKFENNSETLSMYEFLNNPNNSGSNNEKMSSSWSSTDENSDIDGLIEQGLRAYARLVERRRLIYGPRSIEELMKGSEPEYKLWKGVDHYRLNDNMSVPTANLIEFVKSFPGFSSLCINDQMVLFRHFGAIFVIFEKYYITYKQGGLHTKRIYRQDYTYVQLDVDDNASPLADEKSGTLGLKTDAFFIPPGIKTSNGKFVDDETLTKLATPYIHYALELLVKPMQQLNFTDVEFIGSVLSLLFDPNLTNLSQEGHSQVKTLRDQLYMDWFNYYDSLGDNYNDAALRMGNTLLIKTVLDDFVRHYKEFFHLLRVFGILEYDKVLDDFFINDN